MQWPRALYDHEEIPPPHCWEEVKQTIAKEPLTLGHQLHEWEDTPPAEAWNHIAAEIREAEPLPRIPAARTLTRRPLVAYAAALAGLLLLSAVLWYAFNDRDNGLNVRDLAAGLTYADSPAQSAAAPDVPEPEPPAQKTETAPESDAANAPLAQAAGSRDVASDAPATPPSPADAGRRAVPVVSVSYADGNYIQLTEPDGDVTRVSYKLDRMVKAMHAGGNNRSQRQEWNRKLETWTSRMAQSTYIPSGGNFFDIAELVEFLNNGQ